MQPVYAAGKSLSSHPAIPYICCIILLLVVVFLSFELGRARGKIKKSSLPEEDWLLVQKINKGFETDEFKMYLQFIVDNKTKKIVSEEALSRWEPANGEVILPGRYIPDEYVRSSLSY